MRLSKLKGYNSFVRELIEPDSVAQLDAHPTGDPRVAGSKYFLRSFFSFPLIQLSISGEECVQQRTKPLQ